jgi:hypothetical protein
MPNRRAAPVHGVGIDEDKGNNAADANLFHRRST